MLLVDDQILFINSLKSVLELNDKNIEVIGVCYNGSEAVDFCKSRKPDVILMDVKMPIMDGVEAVERILSIDQKLKIVMLTTFDEDEYVKKALRKGAKGYLLKDMLPSDLIYTIKNVVKGMISISPSLIHKTLMMASDKKLPSWYDELNRKELEVLKYLAHGYNNNEISVKVHLSPQTVKNYVSTIYEKMDIRDRMQAMRTCIDLKLFDD
ncbi:MAG: response regulator transcription factor [Spirochaetaceae bacterium]